MKEQTKCSKKNSFILYIDSLDIVSELSDKQTANLFRGIISYAKGEEPKLSKIERIAFLPIKNYMDRNAKKYMEIVEKRRIAGSIGGKANASKSKQVLASASKSKQRVANQADSVSVNDSVSDSDIKAPPPKKYNSEFVRKVINYLQKKINNELDGGINLNVMAAVDLKRKIDKQFPNEKTFEVARWIIDKALELDFHGENLTSIKYLANNFMKVYKSVVEENGEYISTSEHVSPEEKLNNIFKDD